MNRKRLPISRIFSLEMPVLRLVQLYHRVAVAPDYRLQRQLDGQVEVPWERMRAFCRYPAVALESVGMSSQFRAKRILTKRLARRLISNL